MSKKHGVLATVTDKFSLKNHGRSDGNNRNYLVDSVKALFESAHVKERLKLGELYGYFGHGRRELSGKLDLSETEIVYHEGKPVVLENIPACRTVDISIDDNGIVSHTQDILDTTAGRAVKAMFDAGVGGWSWATGGVQTMKGAIAKSFHGFDFVKHPSYINLEKQQMMLESVNANSPDQLLEMMLESQGFDKKQGNSISALLSKLSPSVIEYDEIQQENIMLESILSKRELTIKELVIEKEKRTQFMLEAVKNSPIMIKQAQIDALTSLSSDDDFKIVKALFESLAVSRNDLPLGKNGSAHVGAVEKSKVIDKDTVSHVVFYNNKPNNPFSA